MAELKEFIVAIELGSSKMTAIAGQKKPDGSISVLAMVREESSSFIHKGVVYNIDKTAQCLSNIVKKLEMQLNTRVRQVFVGVGGQSVHSVRNTIVHNLDVETIVTREMVTELMDENRATDYPDQAVLEIVEQEYRVDSNLQTDPVGIRASRLEGNFLNILIRRSFLQNLIKSFEAADVKVAGMFVAPIELGNVLVSENVRRSGCAIVDLGADTTTVAVYSRNLLRHLVVIPLGANNITKDIATLQMEESEAEKMKLKYASAYTDLSEIDDTLRYSIDVERQVESRKFTEIVEARVEEIILNVREHIPAEYGDKLLGGIILTGGGSNLKNIDIAFRTHTIDKVSIASFVSIAINSGDPVIKRRDGMCNTILGLLAKGYENCAGADLSKRDLFTPEDTPDEEDDGSGKANNFGGALAGEKARQEKERKEKAEQERLERERLEALRKKELEDRIRQENEKKPWNRFKKFISKVTEDMVRGEE